MSEPNFDRWLDAECERWRRATFSDPDVTVCPRCLGEEWEYVNGDGDDIQPCQECEGRGWIPSRDRVERERSESIRDDEYLEHLRVCGDLPQNWLTECER